MREKDWIDDFEEYFHARRGPLRRTGYALTGDWQLAEDLTQATFLRLYRHWPRVRKLNVDAYARRTLINAYLDGRKYHAEVPREHLPEQTMPDSRIEDRLDLDAALTRLAPQMRAIVVLRFLEDLSVREVATTLGIAEGTVKSATHSALKALQSHIATVSNTTNEQGWGAAS
jgi:RNA polymerase sigma-70 factor (sigma-E family)